VKGGRILILTGDFGAGKTTVCRRLAESARKRGVHAAGVISPALFEDGEKTGINALDIQTGETRSLAVLRQTARSSLETGRWSFFPRSMEWANRVLRNACPCTLLIIDELGPLELERRQGWTAGIDALDSRAYEAAVAVIRPALVETARARWPHARTRQITPQTAKDKALEEILPLIGLPL
jgi:nucleoside-triphosphatase THEP1